MRKALTIILLSCFIFSVNVPVWAEASLWQERAKMQSSLLNPSSRDLRQVLFNWESPLAAFTTVAISENHSDSFKESFSQEQREFFRKLEATVGSVAQIGNLFFPSDWNKSNPFVVYIRDIHGNPSAQNNVARIIDSLKKESPLFIGLEGAAGRFDFSLFQAFPSDSVRKNTAQFLLANSFLSGAEYSGVTDKENRLNFWGIETPLLYLEHVAALKESVSTQSSILAKIQQTQNFLEKLKQKFYNSNLLRIDQIYRKYNNKQIGLVDYLLALDQEENVKLSSNLKKVLAICLWEKQLNRNILNQERRQVFTLLQRQLAAPELETLVRMTLSYQAKTITGKQYYAYFTALCLRQNIDLAAKPQLEGYMRYSLLSESLNSGEVLKDLENLLQILVHSRTHTAKEKEIAVLSKTVDLAEKVVRYQATPHDWKNYLALRPNLSNLNARLKLLAPHEHIQENWPQQIPAFEKFNEAALKRDQSLTQNFLSKLRTLPEQKLAVLVAGGFHTEGIESRLKEKKIAHVILTPKLNYTTNNSSDYLTAFTRNKTDLERYFSGERITLSPQLPTAEQPIGSQKTYQSEILPKLFEAIAASGWLAEEAAKEQPKIKARLKKLENTLNTALSENKQIRSVKFHHIKEDRANGTLKELLFKLSLEDSEGKKIEMIVLVNKKGEEPKFKKKIKNETILLVEMENLDGLEMRFYPKESALSEFWQDIKTRIQPEPGLSFLKNWQSAWVQKYPEFLSYLEYLWVSQQMRYQLMQSANPSKNPTELDGIEMKVKNPLSLLIAPVKEAQRQVWRRVGGVLSPTWQSQSESDSTTNLENLIAQTWQDLQPLIDPESKEAIDINLELALKPNLWRDWSQARIGKALGAEVRLPEEEEIKKMIAVLSADQKRTAILEDIQAIKSGFNQKQKEMGKTAESIVLGQLELEENLIQDHAIARDTIYALRRSDQFHATALRVAQRLKSKGVKEPLGYGLLYAANHIYGDLVGVSKENRNAWFQEQKFTQLFPNQITQRHLENYADVIQYLNIADNSLARTLEHNDPTLFILKEQDHDAMLSALNNESQKGNIVLSEITASPFSSEAQFLGAFSPDEKGALSFISGKLYRVIQEAAQSPKEKHVLWIKNVEAMPNDVRLELQELIRQRRMTHAELGEIELPDNLQILFTQRRWLEAGDLDKSFLDRVVVNQAVDLEQPSKEYERQPLSTDTNPEITEIDTQQKQIILSNGVSIPIADKIAAELSEKKSLKENLESVELAIGLVLNASTLQLFSSMQETIAHRGLILEIPGETGIGKTAAAEGFAKLTGKSFYGETINASFDFGDLTGSLQQNDRGGWSYDLETKFRETLANGGVVALSEINTLIDEKGWVSLAWWLNTVLDAARSGKDIELTEIPVPGGTLKVNPNTLIVMDMNPAGKTYKSRGEIPPVLKERINRVEASPLVEGSEESKDRDTAKLRKYAEFFIRQIEKKSRQETKSANELADTIAVKYLNAIVLARNNHNGFSSERIFSIRELMRITQDSVREVMQGKETQAAIANAFWMHVAANLPPAQQKQVMQGLEFSKYDGNIDLSVQMFEAKRSPCIQLDANMDIDPIFQNLRNKADIETVALTALTDRLTLEGGIDLTDGHFQKMPGLIGQLVARAEANPQKQQVLILENAEQIPPRVAIALNGILQSRKFYSGGKQEITLPDNAHILLISRGDLSWSPAEKSRLVQFRHNGKTIEKKESKGLSSDLKTSRAVQLTGASTEARMQALKTAAEENKFSEDEISYFTLQEGSELDSLFGGIERDANGNLVRRDSVWGSEFLQRLTEGGIVAIDIANLGKRSQKILYALAPLIESQGEFVLSNRLHQVGALARKLKVHDNFRLVFLAESESAKFALPKSFKAQIPTVQLPKQRLPAEIEIEARDISSWQVNGQASLIFAPELSFDLNQQIDRTRQDLVVVDALPDHTVEDILGGYFPSARGMRYQRGILTEHLTRGPPKTVWIRNFELWPAGIQTLVSEGVWRGFKMDEHNNARKKIPQNVHLVAQVTSVEKKSLTGIRSDVWNRYRLKEESQESESPEQKAVGDSVAIEFDRDGKIVSIGGVQLNRTAKAKRPEEVSLQHRITHTPNILRALKELALAEEEGRAAQLIGETGIAKSTLAGYYAEITGRTPYKYSVHGRSHFTHLAYQYKQKDGIIELQMQRFYKLIAQGNAVLILDEANVSPELLWAVKPLLLGETILPPLLSGTQPITVGPNIQIILTLNPASYSSRFEFNAALTAKTKKINVTTPTIYEKASILKNKYLSPDAIDVMRFSAVSEENNSSEHSEVTGIPGDLDLPAIEENLLIAEAKSENKSSSQGNRITLFFASIAPPVLVFIALLFCAAVLYGIYVAITSLDIDSFLNVLESMGIVIGITIAIIIGLIIFLKVIGVNITKFLKRWIKFAQFMILVLIIGLTFYTAINGEDWNLFFARLGILSLTLILAQVIMRILIAFIPQETLEKINNDMLSLSRSTSQFQTILGLGTLYIVTPFISFFYALFGRKDANNIMHKRKFVNRLDEEGELYLPYLKNDAKIEIIKPTNQLDGDLHVMEIKKERLNLSQKWNPVEAQGADVQVQQISAVDWRDRPVEVEWGQDSAGNLLVHRKTGSGRVWLTYNLSIPNFYRNGPIYNNDGKRITVSTSDLPEDVKFAVSESGFKEGEKIYQGEAIRRLTEFLWKFNSLGRYLSGKTELEILVKSKAGACAHRSYVFARVAEALGLEVRVTNNSIHAFNEVKIDGRGWVRIDPTNPHDIFLEGKRVREEIEEDRSEQKKARLTFETLLAEKMTDADTLTWEAATTGILNISALIKRSAKPFLRKVEANLRLPQILNQYPAYMTAMKQQDLNTIESLLERYPELAYAKNMEDQDLLTWAANENFADPADLSKITKIFMTATLSLNWEKVEDHPILQTNRQVLETVVELLSSSNLKKIDLLLKILSKNNSYDEFHKIKLYEDILNTNHTRAIDNLFRFFNAISLDATMTSQDKFNFLMNLINATPKDQFAELYSGNPILILALIHLSSTHNMEGKHKMEILNTLIEKSNDTTINWINEKLSSALMLALRYLPEDKTMSGEDKNKIIQQIFERSNSTTINQVSNQGWSPLIVALNQLHQDKTMPGKGTTAIIQKLVEQSNRTTINQINDHGCSPLMIALKYLSEDKTMPGKDKTAIIQKLVEQSDRTTINQVNNLGWSALMFAGHYLLRDATILGKDKTAIMQKLIAQSDPITINQVNDQGWSTLMYALHFLPADQKMDSLDKISIIQALITPTTVNQLNHKGFSPLTLALHWLSKDTTMKKQDRSRVISTLLNTTNLEILQSDLERLYRFSEYKPLIQKRIVFLSAQERKAEQVQNMPALFPFWPKSWVERHAGTLAEIETTMLQTQLGADILKLLLQGLNGQQLDDAIQSLVEQSADAFARIHNQVWQSINGVLQLVDATPDHFEGLKQMALKMNQNFTAQILANVHAVLDRKSSSMDRTIPTETLNKISAETWEGWVNSSMSPSIALHQLHNAALGFVNRTQSRAEDITNAEINRIIQEQNLPRRLPAIAPFLAKLENPSSIIVADQKVQKDHFKIVAQWLGNELSASGSSSFTPEEEATLTRTLRYQSLAELQKTLVLAAEKSHAQESTLALCRSLWRSLATAAVGSQTIDFETLWSVYQNMQNRASNAGGINTEEAKSIWQQSVRLSQTQTQALNNLLNVGSVKSNAEAESITAEVYNLSDIAQSEATLEALANGILEGRFSSGTRMPILFSRNNNTNTKELRKALIQRGVRLNQIQAAFPDGIEQAWINAKNLGQSGVTIEVEVPTLFTAVQNKITEELKINISASTFAMDILTTERIFREDWNRAIPVRLLLLQLSPIQAQAGASTAKELQATLILSRQQ